MTGERLHWATMADKQAIEAIDMAERWQARTVFEMLSETTARHPSRSAVSFQLKSGPADSAETLDWQSFRAEVIRTANMLRRLGIGPNDVVAYMLPNCTETAVTLLAGMTAGIVAPINPLLETEHIAAILRETGAKVLVTLASFVKTDVAQKAHAAVAHAPDVEVVLEVDLKRYLSPPISWLIPLLRPRLTPAHSARVLDFHREKARESGDALSFAEEGGGTRICANFHTGGTTGMPKIAQHDQNGAVYNGELPALSVVCQDDVLLCPLPLFHVFGAYPILMTCVASGAHLVLPTPAGYRGDGVMDNFWKLIERWGVTFMVMVPTAASALMQRKVDADVSTLRHALCGSAPLPVELFKRFEDATGVKILEGYGMTEATCLISINPPDGERKIGSVGLPIPYTDVKILHCDAHGTITRECGTDEIGEICVSSPGVFPGYKEESLNVGLFTGGEERFLRTGDLGRIDADGYVWITGRAKDLIIRGGHNIDPALIEEALAGHPAIAFVGAIGQPDAHSGEVPCAYVELNAGASVSSDELMAFARERIHERAAIPKYVEVMDELPKTAVGKVFKPDLRKRAIRRIYGAALEAEGIAATIEVVEDKKLGLTAEISVSGADEAMIEKILGPFARPWRLVG